MLLLYLFYTNFLVLTISKLPLQVSLIIVIMYYDQLIAHVCRMFIIHLFIEDVSKIKTAQDVFIFS